MFCCFQFPPVSLTLRDVIDNKNDEEDHQHTSDDRDPGYSSGEMMRRDLLLFQADHRVFEFFFFKVFQYSFEAFRDVLTTLDKRFPLAGRLPRRSLPFAAGTGSMNPESRSLMCPCCCSSRPY